MVELYGPIRNRCRTRKLIPKITVVVEGHRTRKNFMGSGLTPLILNDYSKLIVGNPYRITECINVLEVHYSLSQTGQIEGKLHLIWSKTTVPPGYYTKRIVVLTSNFVVEVDNLFRQIYLTFRTWTVCRQVQNGRS